MCLLLNVKCWYLMSPIYPDVIEIKLTNIFFQVSVVLMYFWLPGWMGVTGHNSGMAARLLPDEVQGHEYYIVTVCTQNQCQFQVSEDRYSLTRSN